MARTHYRVPPRQKGRTHRGLSKPDTAHTYKYTLIWNTERNIRSRRTSGMRRCCGLFGTRRRQNGGGDGTRMGGWHQVPAQVFAPRRLWNRLETSERLSEADSNSVGPASNSVALLGPLGLDGQFNQR